MDRNETKIDGLAKGIDFYDEKLDKIEARLKSIANFLHLGSGAGETRHPRQAEGVSFALESRNSSKEPATVRENHCSNESPNFWTPMLNEPPSLDDANHSPSRADKGPFGEQVPLVQLLQTQQGLLEAMKAYSAQVDDMQQVSKQKLVEMTLQLQEANGSPEAPKMPVPDATAERQLVTWGGCSSPRPANVADFLQALASKNRKVTMTAGEVLLAMVGAHPRWSLDTSAAATFRELLRPWGDLDGKPLGGP
eukprot:g189.t1